MIDILLLAFLVIIAVAAIMMKDILDCIMLLGAYSFIMALVWTNLNAVDVAFTEIAVGAGITTVLMIAAITRTPRKEAERPEPKKRRRMAPLVLVILTGLALGYGTIDMPPYGAVDVPARNHLMPEYIERAYHETGSDNIVTPILASYRGYDTLGETTVVFTAGITLILLLRNRRRFDEE